MQRIVSSITTLAQHFETMASSPQSYRLPACPRCGLGGPRIHGSYDRKVDRKARSGHGCRVVQVPRFFCRGCERTHSRLPQCIAPRRWYDWAVQQIVLALAGVSVRACAQRVGVGRHTVRRWRDWLLAPPPGICLPSSQPMAAAWALRRRSVVVAPGSGLPGPGLGHGVRRYPDGRPMMHGA